MSRQDFAVMNNDLLFNNGDIAVSISDVQHVMDTIAAFPGWWKEFPSDGVGLFAYLGSVGQEQVLNRSIQIQLKADGYRAGPDIVSSPNGTFEINPSAVAQNA